MLDVYMVAALAGLFVLLYTFVLWCGQVVDDKGGAGQ